MVGDMRRMMSSRIVWCLGLTALFAGLFSAPFANAIEVSATIDRSPIYLDESVNLVLTAEGEMTGMDSPDVSPLHQDFEILGQSTQTNINIVNNTPHIVQSWIFEIQPKRLGQIEIPSLGVAGEQTQPIQLAVREFTGNLAVAGADIFLEVEVSSDNPYVQSQVNFTTRLFYSIPILNGKLSDPDLPFGTVEGMAQDKRYNAKRAGVDYRVIERRYAFFPEQSGLFSVPPIEFTCLLERKDPVTQSLFHVRERYSSNSISLEVKPIPRSFTGATWLPAQDLKLLDSWQGRAPKFEFGKPEARRISIDSVGLRAVQLPAVNFEENATARIYGGSNADLRTSQTYDWAVVRRTDEFAIIPQSDTRVEVPEFSIVWWDVNEDREKVAKLPPISIDIGHPINLSQPNEAGGNAQSEPTDVAQDRVSGVAAIGQWQLISLALLVIWLLTILAWYAKSRTARARSFNENAGRMQRLETENRLRQNIQSACQTGDAKLVSHSMLEWACVYWRDSAPRNLLELGCYLDSAELIEELQNLDRKIYAGETSSWDGSALWRYFVSALNARAKGQRNHQRRFWKKSRGYELDELWPGESHP